MAASFPLRKAPSKTSALLRTSWLLSLLLSAACGSSAPAVDRADPLPATLAPYFDNGVDFVADPEVLEGEWRRDWSTELDTRVQESDTIAMVSVRTLREDIDPDGQTTYRVVIEEGRRVLGNPVDGQTLLVQDGALGFNSVAENVTRVQSMDWVLFLKWGLVENEVVAHWHLSPGTQPVIERVDYLAERRRGVERDSNATVFVHEN